jgi:TonB family protein
MNIRLLCVALLITAPAAFAQSTFRVLEDDGPHVVRGFSIGLPVFEKDGKMVNGTGTRGFSLGKAAAYGKGFVTISGFTVTCTPNTDQTIYAGEINGHLQSEVTLKRCFFVLEIKSGLSKGLYATELDEMTAGKSVLLHLIVKLLENLPEGQYEIHIFSDGLEMLNSRMSPDYVAEQTKKTDELIAKSHDHPVSMSRTVAPVLPVYPAALVAQGLTGMAKVSCTINEKGDVTDVKVVGADNPLFGEALATAARQWKFDPAVKAGQFVESTAVIPFTFKPSAPAPKP